MAEAARFSTRCVGIKSSGFAKDILHFFRIAVWLYESSIMHLHCVLSCFTRPKGRLLDVPRDPLASKVVVLLRTSFTFSSSQYACMKASSCIYIVFYHASGLLRGGASRCSTGTVRIKSDGFAKDILRFFRIAVCVHDGFIIHLHCVSSCFTPPKGEGF